MTESRSSLHERRIEAVSNSDDGLLVMYRFQDETGADMVFVWFNEQDLRDLAKDFLSEAEDLKSGLHRK